MLRKAKDTASQVFFHQVRRGPRARRLLTNRRATMGSVTVAAKVAWNQ